MENRRNNSKMPAKYKGTDPSSCWRLPDAGWRGKAGREVGGSFGSGHFTFSSPCATTKRTEEKHEQCHWNGSLQLGISMLGKTDLQFNVNAPF